MVSHSVYVCVCVWERKEAVWGKFCFRVCSKPRHNSGMDEVCLCAGMVVNNSWVVCVFIYTTLKMFTCEAHEETVSRTHISADKLWAMPINYLWFKWRRTTFEATSQRHHCVWTFTSALQKKKSFWLLDENVNETRRRASDNPSSFPFLSRVCLLLFPPSSQAPFTPFITEMMYQNLCHLIDPASVEEKDTSSIHYLMLPQVRLVKSLPTHNAAVRVHSHFSQSLHSYSW